MTASGGTSIAHGIWKRRFESSQKVSIGIELAGRTVGLGIQPTNLSQANNPQVTAAMPSASITAADPISLARPESS